MCLICHTDPLLTDVASVVLDKCITKQKSRDGTLVDYDYEFLDDDQGKMPVVENDKTDGIFTQNNEPE